MLKNIALSFLAVASLAAVGCGGGDDTSTITPTGGDDMSMMAVYKVVSGSYTVSNVTKVSDDCMLALEDPNTGFTSLQVTNNGQGHLSLGSQCASTGNPPTCNPAVFTNGEGDFTDSYHVTATATTTVTADAGCMYDRTRTNKVTVTANNTLHIEFQEDESSPTTGCGFSYTSCTSKYTFDATM